MSILADVVAALNVSGVTDIAGADGKPAVYTDALPQDKAMPAVVIRRTAYDEVMTLAGPEGTKHSVYAFECFAPRKQTAMDLRDAVIAAIEAAAALVQKFRVTNDDEPAYDPETDQFREVVSYSFWHS